jgi:histidine ammonia-lyase
MVPKKPLLLTGKDLSFQDAIEIAHGKSLLIDPIALAVVRKSAALIQTLSKSSGALYGINTGFGLNANKKISKFDLHQLQRNLLLSHAAGYGELLTLPETRLMIALRLNVLLQGYTGVREEVCRLLFSFLEHEIYPCIPSLGSVGASGDLAPLAHLALPLIGEGEVQFQGAKIASKAALKQCGLKPVILEPKEGLGLINGTQGMVAVGSLAVHEGVKLAALADLIAALSLEGFQGHVDPLDPRIHALRHHPGQIQSAKKILGALKGSYLFDPLERSFVQDPYSFRCTPQVHGASLDALDYTKTTLERELNAVTDNPLVFVKSKEILSGGNFHGQPLALSLDTAAMAVAELANISERRLELLLNPHFSGLSPFLAAHPGLESGYMALQYLSASLVNTNKILSHPASTDSIPGNAGIEDHVSMGMTSALKLKKIGEQVKICLAVELLAACQAVDLRKVKKMGKETSRLYQAVRKTIPPLTQDRIVSYDIEKACKLEIWHG